jgi:hypothetical protein
LQHYRDGDATPAERLELMQLLHTGELETPVRQWLLGMIQQHGSPNEKADALDQEKPNASLHEKPDALGQEKAEQVLTAILQAGRVAAGLRAQRPRHILSWKLAAAAAVLFVIGYTALRIDRHQTSAAVAKNAQPPRQDVPPGKHAAVLTLANGRKILLDNAQSDTVGRQGNSTVINTRGMLSYHGPAASGSADPPAAASTYNTLTTNAGNQYEVILPDGSKVWLNAASSIRFPVSFGNNERKVAITGEAYFEVAACAGHPFVVQHGTTVVRVLGTSFNMNTYEDESALTTTLLTGAIRIGQGANSRVMRPGQQARLGADDKLTVIDDVNTEEVVAWKNDLFYFRGADMGSIMRQLTRWYGIQVEGDTHIQERFYAKIPKTASLKEVLNAFSLTEKVHFEIEGRTVKIMP